MATTKRAVKARPAGDLTKERILAAAERLFADAGFEGVSMRQVGAAADVPFALVTYHFQTKLGLYREVFRRRSRFTASARIEQLEAIKISGQPLEDVRAVAAALVEPLMRVRHEEGGLHFSRLMSREVNDPQEAERGIVAECFDPMARAAISILKQAVPSASDQQIYWAYHFATGAIAVNHANTGRIERLSEGLCQSTNVSELIRELTKFISAGMAGALCPELLHD